MTIETLIGRIEAAGPVGPINTAFLGESIALLAEATMDGRLQRRTGLSRADAFAELNSLVLRVLGGPHSGAQLIDAAS